MVVSRTYNVGAHDSFISYATASRPKWVDEVSSLLVGGTAELPSGHRRLIVLDGMDQRTQYDCYVNPVSLGTTSASWRAVIYAPNGSYITSSGMGDIPTIGTPTVRIGVNAPSKAVVKFPVMKNDPRNILSSSFAGWSDGHTGKVDRGMEITVEYRDRTSGSMKMVFRGMIYQIESGEAITVTAYDRLMDMVQYSDQYQSHAGYTQNDTSKSRTTSGSNYIYTMNNNVGTLITANAINILTIDATSQMNDGGSSHTAPQYIAHPLPKVNTGGVDYTPEQGKKITHVKAKVYEWVKATRGSNSAPVVATVAFSAVAILYRKNGTSLTEVTRSTSKISYVYPSNTSLGTVTADGTNTINWDVDWTIETSPSDYCIGMMVRYFTITTSGWTVNESNCYADYSTTRYTVTGNYYTSSDGVNWTQVSSGGQLPELSISFERTGGSINTGSITVSGASLTIAQSSIPLGPSATYLSTTNAGASLAVSYFISGAAGLREIIYDLIDWAGLVPDVVNENMGQTSYYSTTTYDFMTCAQEMLKGGNYGLFASVNEPGKAYVRPRHTISETPVTTFTTDPADYGTYEMEIVSHNLTAHWMSEKATQAYIAEDATTSGLPVALETDDALMANSLVNTMQSPLRSILTDNTLGTHAMMANAASGKMVQLHTNVFEGSMVLAGYRLDIWDFNSGYAGGNPIGIRVPEYGAQGTAIPTEIVICDGVTQVSLNNIRTADRSEVANSMGLSADANSNSADNVPETVYIFARVYNGSKYATPSSVTNVKLYDEDGVIATQSTAAYIKIVEDNVGYTHIAAIFPSSAKPSGYAPSKPIIYVSATWGGVEKYAIFDNPKYAYDGQSVHVDFRFERS